MNECKPLLPGHAGMSAAFQASTAFNLTGGGAGSADRSGTEAQTVVKASLWSAPGASLKFAARGSFAFPCAGYARQGLTLVHFSAQLNRFL